MGSCLEHGKDLILFCTETRCKTLICTVCMTKRHLGHKVVDKDVDRKEELLSSLTSAIESMSSRKRLIETIQAEVGRRNERCLNNLSKEKQSTLKMMKDRYDSLLAVAANQKDKSSARIKSEMTSLEESLSLLNNIKQYLDEETLSPRDVRDCEETIKKITEHIDHILTTPPSKEYVVYIENKRKDRLVEELCGELMQRNKEGTDKHPEKLGSIFATGVQKSGGLFVKPDIQSNLGIGTTFLQSSTQPFTQSGLNLGLGTTVQQPSIQAVKPVEKSGLGFGFGTTVQQPSTQSVKPVEKSGLGFRFGTTVQQPSTQAVKPIENTGLGFRFGTTVQQPSTQAVKPAEKSGLGFGLGTSVQQPSTQPVKPITQSGLGLGTSVQQPSTQAVKPAEKSGFGFGLGTTIQQSPTQPIKPVEKSGFGFGLGTSVQQPSIQPVKPVEKSGFGFGLTTPVQQSEQMGSIFGKSSTQTTFVPAKKSEQTGSIPGENEKQSTRNTDETTKTLSAMPLVDSKNSRFQGKYL